VASAAPAGFTRELLEPVPAPSPNGRAGTGAALLDAVLATLRRFVAYPSDAAAVAHALWVAHCHLVEAFETTPRLAFLSPEPGSGKSRALEVTAALVPRPLESMNATPAYLFRSISGDAGLPTVLLDEADAIFGPKAPGNEDLRAFLNAGHRRGATAGRCIMVGKRVETEELPAFCPVAVAGLGNLPDTIMTRAVVIRMRKRRPDEAVTPYRRRDAAAETGRLREALAAWAGDHMDEAARARPDLPDGIADRAADVWEPLIIVADLAGGDWPRRARAAAVEFVRAAVETPASLGVRLLADIRFVFQQRGCTDIATADLLADLLGLDEAPWPDLRGKPLNPARLARMLEPYGVRSGQMWIGGRNVRGFREADFQDPWGRYLPAPEAGQ